MTPPPIDEPALPLEPKRPTALTVVSIIGIIFGTLGTLCVCGGLAAALMKTSQPAVQGSFTFLILQMTMSVASLLIATFLLIGSIGAINLRPWSWMIMIVVNIINVMYQIFALIIGFAMIIPQTLSQMQQVPTEATEQQIKGIQAIQAHIGLVKGAAYSITILMFVIQAGYSLITVLVMKRADVKRALSNPMDAPQTPMM